MDIVERLRLGGPNAAEVTDEAADEIERLRAALLEIVSMPDHEFITAGYHSQPISSAASIKRIARKALGETDE